SVPIQILYTYFRSWSWTGVNQFRNRFHSTRSISVAYCTITLNSSRTIWLWIIIFIKWSNDQFTNYYISLSIHIEISKSRAMTLRKSNITNTFNRVIITYHMSGE